MDIPLSGIIGGLVGGSIGGGLVFWVGLKLPLTKCPKCGTLPPRFRKPANFHQMMWGGNTCKKCDTEVDRRCLNDKSHGRSSSQQLS